MYDPQRPEAASWELEILANPQPEKGLSKALLGLCIGWIHSISEVYLRLPEPLWGLSLIFLSESSREESSLSFLSEAQTP